MGDGITEKPLLCGRKRFVVSMLAQNLICTLKRYLLLGGMLFFVQGNMMGVAGSQHNVGKFQPYQGQSYCLSSPEYIFKVNSYKMRSRLYRHCTRLYYEELEKYRQELTDSSVYVASLFQNVPNPDDLFLLVLESEQLVYYVEEAHNREVSNNSTCLKTTHRDFVPFKYGLFRAPDSLFHPMALFAGMLALYILFRGGFCYFVGEQPPTFGRCFSYFLFFLIFTSMGQLMVLLLVWIAYYNVGWATISVHCYYPLLCYLLLLILCTVVWDFFLYLIGYSDLSSLLGIGRWFPPLCLFSLTYVIVWFFLPWKYLLWLLTLIDKPLKSHFCLFDIDRGRRRIPQLNYGLLLSFILIDFVFNIYFGTNSLQASWKRSSWGLLGGKVLTAFYMVGFKVWRIDKNKNEKERYLFLLFLSWWLFQHVYPYFERLLRYLLTTNVLVLMAINWICYYPLILGYLYVDTRNRENGFKAMAAKGKKYFSILWKLCLFLYVGDFLTWMLGFQDEIVVPDSTRVKASAGVRGGEGVTLLPNYLAQDSQQKGDLVPVLPSEVVGKGESDGLAPASGDVAMPPEDDGSQPTIESAGISRKYRRYGALLLLFLLAIAIIMGPYKGKDEGEGTSQ